MNEERSIAKKELTFDDDVIKKIAGIASRNVNGVLSLEGGMFSNISNRFRNSADPTQGVSAQVGEKQVAINLNITVEYGKDIREIFDQICERVTQDINRMTGLEVIELTVQIEDIMNKQEWQEQATGKPNSNIDNDNQVE